MCIYTYMYTPVHICSKHIIQTHIHMYTLYSLKFLQCITISLWQQKHCYFHIMEGYKKLSLLLKNLQTSWQIRKAHEIIDTIKDKCITGQDHTTSPSSILISDMRKLGPEQSRPQVTYFISGRGRAIISF